MSATTRSIQLPVVQSQMPMLVLKTAVGVIAIDAILWLLANGRPLTAFVVSAAALPFVAGKGRNQPRSRDVWVGQITEAKPGLRSAQSDPPRRANND